MLLRTYCCLLPPYPTARWIAPLLPASWRRSGHRTAATAPTRSPSCGPTTSAPQSCISSETVPALLPTRRMSLPACLLAARRVHHRSPWSRRGRVMSLLQVLGPRAAYVNVTSDQQQRRSSTTPTAAAACAANGPQQPLLTVAARMQVPLLRAAGARRLRL